MEQKSGGRNKWRKQVVGAGLDDAQAKSQAVVDAKNEVQLDSIEADGSVEYAVLDADSCPILYVNSSIQSSHISSEISCQEVASYSTLLCEHYQEGLVLPGKSYNRSLCADNRACLWTIVDACLKDRSDLHFELYEGFADERLEKDKSEGTDWFFQCMRRENLIGQSDFVCRSGLLPALCKTPYTSGGDFDHGIIVAIQKIGSTYYMQPFRTNSLRHWEESNGTQIRKNEYGGKRFEALVSAYQNKTATYNLNKEYVSVRRIQLGGHSLIIRGEIDGCRPDNQSYVEVKTTSDEHDALRPSTALTWWFQCYFLGAENILCGFRNNETGIVKRIKWYKVDDLIKKAQTQSLSPEIGMKFLNALLDFVKRHVTKEDQLYYLKRKKGSRAFILHRRKKSDKKYSFLPQWFHSH